MNRQRKVLTTITYNEMGIIIDTKVEELGSSAQLGTNLAEVGAMTNAEAIDVIRDYLVNKVDNEPMQKACQLAIKALSAEPQERTGKWIDETFKPWGLVHHPYRCSLCGEHAEYDSMFCPNCGAKMEVDT